MEDVLAVPTVNYGGMISPLMLGVDVDHEELIVIPDGSGFRVEANPKDSDR